MKVLVINAGSSSLKYQVIDMENETCLAKGVCERIGDEGSVLKHKKTGSDEVVIESNMPSHKEAMQLVLDALVNKDHGVVASMKEIGAVGHRVLHSGEDFNCSVVVDDKNLEIIKKNKPLGPLHMPANIMGIEACREVMPGTPNVAVFDTAFHMTMPEKAYLYGVRYEDYEQFKVRRYGFHGTSHKFVSGETAKFLGKDIKDLRIVTCHLGNGSSLAAIKGGKVIDTSMGFTPLEGMPMGTRSGDIDPAAVEYLMEKKNLNIHEMLQYLNKKCGMLGISGVSGDYRDLCRLIDEGNPRAKLAVDMFCYRVKKILGGYIAAMGGVDVVVFTAGVGEHTEIVRSQVLEDMEYCGIELDEVKNNSKDNGNRVISKDSSRVKVLVIPTNEELVIARETKELVEG